MIQDIAPAFFNNHYEKKTPDASSTVMFVKDDEVLYKKENGRIVYPGYSEYDMTDVELRYIFSIDEKDFFLAFEKEYIDTDEISDTPYSRLLSCLMKDGFSFYNRMTLRIKEDKLACFAGATAYQIGAWYADNRICGRCGSVLVHDEKERMMRCGSCGNMIFPKICPAVIVAVIDKDRILLTKYSTGYRNFALIAGFAESGETIEETVHREVMEEVGLKVKNLRYYKSQPWTFTDTLLFGFFCEVDRDTHITMDTQELSYANWVERAELDEVEDDGISLTREMIRVFKEGKA